MSNLLHKVKDAVTGDKTHHDNPSSANTAGPHSSNVSNKADPRVDSDLDGSRNAGVRDTNNYGSTTAGPHSSNVANKADPRVDSDLDGRGGLGGTTGGLGGSSTMSGGYGSSGVGTTGGAYDSTNAGPHSSNLANKADPRIDSDRDNRGAYGTSHTAGSTGLSTGGAGYGSGAGYGATSGNTSGPHSSNMANKADPRIDSDRDHRGNPATSSYAPTGPADNTAGPHKNDMMNKMDPRVDSDLDGSKTVGGDKTYG